MGFLLRGFCAIGVVACLLFTTLGCSSSPAAAPFAPRRVIDITDPAPPPLGAAAEPVPPALAPASRAQPARVAQLTQQRRFARARDLRVMSFNIRVAIFVDAMNHWQFRKELLVDTIRNFNPDLLGTQEALASQTDYLRQRLHDYDFVGAGRSDGARRGEMCGVFFRRDRFDKVGEGHFWLSETPAQPGSKSWGSTFPRMVTWVVLRDRDDGSVFCWFNTHFDHRGRRAREQSATLMRRMIDRIAGSMPVVITGDFNTGEDTPPYRTLIAGAHAGDERLVDTYRAFDRTPDRQEGTRHDFWGGRGGERIDWIVTTPSFQTVHAAIDRTHAGGRYPSDHFPVTAIIRQTDPLPLAQIE